MLHIFDNFFTCMVKRLTPAPRTLRLEMRAMKLWEIETYNI